MGKHPGGQPGLEITKDMIEKAEHYASTGLTIEQIASCLGMGVSTLYNKKANCVEFEEAIKRGRNKGIQVVANALFEGAMSGDKVLQMFYLKCRAGWRDQEPPDKNDNNEMKEAITAMKELAQKCLRQS